VGDQEGADSHNGLQTKVKSVQEIYYFGFPNDQHSMQQVHLNQQKG
jgi:hypothetical protein